MASTLIQSGGRAVRWGEVMRSSRRFKSIPQQPEKSKDFFLLFTPTETDSTPLASGLKILLDSDNRMLFISQMQTKLFVDQMGNSYQKPILISDEDWTCFRKTHELVKLYIANGSLKPLNDISHFLRGAVIAEVKLRGGTSSENKFSQTDFVTIKFDDGRELEIQTEWHGNECSLKGALTTAHDDKGLAAG